MGHEPISYAPWEFVVTVRLIPLSSFLATTVDPTITAPLESRTVPSINAVDCANAFTAQTMINTKHMARPFNFVMPRLPKLVFRLQLAHRNAFECLQVLLVAWVL